MGIVNLNHYKIVENGDEFGIGYVLPRLAEKFGFCSYNECGDEFISDCFETTSLTKIVKDANLLDDIYLVLRCLGVEMKEREAFDQIYHELRIKVVDANKRDKYRYGLFRCILFIDRLLARLNQGTLFLGGVVGTPRSLS